MNHKARELGMNDTRYVEPTGLSSAQPVERPRPGDAGQGGARAPDHPRAVDLARVRGRGRQPSGSSSATPTAWCKSPEWDIGLQKTGYISEAGRCLVMQAKLAGRQLIMVFLDSAGKYSRIGDAERVRRWITERRCRRAAGSLDARASPSPKPSDARRRQRAQPRCPRAAEICAAVARSRSSQLSSSRSAGAEIDRPATSLPWSSRMPAAMQRTPSSSSSSSRAVPYWLTRASSRSSAVRSVMLLRGVAGQPGAGGVGAHALRRRRAPGTACRPT